MLEIEQNKDRTKPSVLVNMFVCNCFACLCVFIELTMRKILIRQILVLSSLLFYHQTVIYAHLNGFDKSCVI